MKNKICFILLIVFISIGSTLFAQQPNFPIKVINGIEYYVYTVTSGEGLYSISRRFGVSQADINNVNPQIHDGLKAGQEILIPKNDEKSILTPVQVSDNVEYVLHTVEKRQTLFAISRKYDVSQELIIQSNPVLRERGIQPGDILRIPVAKKSVQTPKTETNPKPTPTVSAVSPSQAPVRTLHIGENENYITHNVAAGETLYSISKKYSVTVDDLIRLNPETSDGLKSGTVLKVPFLSGKDAGNAPSQAVSQTTNTPVKQEVVQKSTYKVAYLLPFLVNDKNDPTAQKFIEFYMGSLLAINNAKNGDLNFEIFSFDTEKTETKLFEVINKPEMQGMDLIIGPAYTAQIPILADFAKRRQINTVIPFSSKVAFMDSNPYLFQFNPDQETQNEYLANLLKNNFRNANLVFVETGNPNLSDDGMDFFNYLKQQLDRNKIGYGTVKKAQLGAGWSTNLATGKKNIVIFDTDNYNSVHTYLSDLHDIGSKFDVSVLGQYSWRGQSGKKPKMYYVSPFSGTKLGTQFYEGEFQKYYGKKLPIINPRYDLLGYDITSYFLSLIRKEGFAFNNSTQTLFYNRGVQSDFNFKRVGKNGGFVNKQLYLIEDESVTK